MEKNWKKQFFFYMRKRWNILYVTISYSFWKWKQLHAFIGNRYLISWQETSIYHILYGKVDIHKALLFLIWPSLFAGGPIIIIGSFNFIFHVCCYKDLVSCIRIKFWRTEEKFPLVAMLAAFNSVFHTVDSEDE